MNFSKTIDRSLEKITDNTQITAAATLSSDVFELIGVDKLQIIVQENGNAINIPASTITVKYYDGWSESRKIQRGSDDTYTLSQVTAGSQQIVEVDDDRVKEARWCEISIPMLYTAAYTTTIYCNKIFEGGAASAIIDTASSTLKVSSVLPEYGEEIVDTTFTASGTYSYYIDKRNYENFSFFPIFTTAAATSFNVFGSLEDVTAGASVSTAGWTNKNDAFGNVITAPFTQSLEYVDNAGRFGGNSFAKIEFTCSAGQTLKILASKWKK